MERQHIEFCVRSVHSNDGTAVPPADYLRIAEEKGIKAIGLTDINSVAGYPEFDNESKRTKIKPVFSVNVFCRHEIDRHATEWFSLTLLVKNKTGFRNLYEIMTLINTSSLKNGSRSCIDCRDVYRRREGLLIGITLPEACDTAVPEGVVPGGRKRCVLDPGTAVLKKHIWEIVDFVEVPPLIPWTDTPEYIKTANGILHELSVMGIPAVAVTNANCITKADEKAFREVNELSATDYARVRYLPNTSEFEKCFDWLGDSVREDILYNNPEKLLERIDELHFTGEKDVPLSMPGAKEELRKRCYRAVAVKYGTPCLEEVCRRIEKELELISNSGSEGWFIVVSEIVNTLESQGYPHSFRGSVGNTLMGYLLGISAVDPIKYGLHPEIFLGQKGEKKADIELIIPEEARPLVRKRLKVMFDGKVYREPDHGYILMPFGEDILDYSPLTRNDRPEPDLQMTCFSAHEIKCPGFHVIDQQLMSELKELKDLTGVTPDEKELCMGPIGSAHDRGSACLMDKVKAETFSESFILIGLAHGTGTWGGNAEELLKTGICTLREVIAFRDDIYQKLSDHGYEPQEAYRLMEKIRKGKGYLLTEDEIVAMRKAGIEEWYIESMQKIKYLFPKSHAIEQAIHAARAEWYERHYPKEYEAVMARRESEPKVQI